MSTGTAASAQKSSLRFARSSFTASFLTLTAGGAISQILLVAASPIVTRLYTASDFGIWSLFTSVVMTVAAVVNWRYELAIVLPENDEEAAGVLTLSAVAATLTVVTAGLLVLLFGSSIAQMVGVPELEPWLWLMPVCLLLAGIYQPFIYWSTRRKLFSNIAISQVGQSGGVVLSQIAIALMFGRSPTGMILGTLAGQAAMVCILWPPVWRQRSLFQRHSMVRRLRPTLHKYRNFPFFTAPYSFIGQLSKRAIFVILGAFATTQEVGLLSLAMNLTYLPASFVAAALNQVFFQKAARETGTRELEQFVLDTIKMLVMVVAPVLVFLAFNVTWILETGLYLAFGPGWTGAASYTISLIFPSTMLIFMSWLDRTYDVLGRQRLALGLQAGYDVVVLGAFALSLALSHNSEIAVGVFSALTAAYYGAWLVITFVVAGFSMRELHKIAWLLLKLCLAAAATHWILVLIFGQMIAASAYAVLTTAYFIYLFVSHRRRLGGLGL